MSDQPLFDAFGSIVDRAHDGCAARQVAQIVHILIGTAGFVGPTASRRGVGGVKLVAQDGRNVFERGRYDFKRSSKNDFSRLERLHVGRIAGGQREPSIGRLCLKNAATSLANSWEERSVNFHNLCSGEFVLNEAVEENTLSLT